MLCVLSISTPQVLSHSSTTYTADALCPISTPKFCPIFHPLTELMLRFLSLHPQVLSHSSSTYRVDALFLISTPPGSVPFFIHLPSWRSVSYFCTPRFCPTLHPAYRVDGLCLLSGPQRVVRGDGDSTTATARFPAHHLGARQPRLISDVVVEGGGGPVFPHQWH